MKPIFRQIQAKLIENLQASELKAAMTITAGDAFSSEERIALQAAQTQPFALFVSLPFPLQTLGLSVSCWGTLSLNCTLIQSLRCTNKTTFIDWAETASFLVTEKPVSIEKTWSGQFVLAEKEPWKWLDIPNEYALQMHFITTNFNINRL